MSQSSRKKIEVYPALQPELFRLDKQSNPHTRVVWSYDAEARKRQAKALRALRAVKFPQGIATARSGKTLFDNVRPHRNNRQFYLTDFDDAYGRVNQDVMNEKVEDILHKHARGRQYDAVRVIIGEYMADGAFLDGVDGLPQGNATSADLFNWYMYDADNALAFALWKRRDTTKEVATRYLDDLTVSSPAADGVSKQTRRLVREIYEYNAPGMQVKHPKSKVLTLGPRPVTVTGLTMYPDGRIAPSPTLLNAASMIFGEMAAKLAEDQQFDLHDYSVVAGYNGVLNLAGESSRSGSRLVRSMGKQAARLMHEIGDRIN